MSKLYTEKIDIFITVDVQIINSYFNSHDPSPIYKKQINQKFEHYILNTVNSAKRYSAIFYKLNCPGAINKQYAEPLMHAIRRHFSMKKAIREKEFIKFKRRNFFLLAVSISIVITLEAFLPIVMRNYMNSIYNGLKNCLDVFSWVILWKPIYELLFSWNPFLKDILLLKKLSTAEVIVLSKNSEGENQKTNLSNSQVELSKTVTFESLLNN